MWILILDHVSHSLTGILDRGFLLSIGYVCPDCRDDTLVSARSELPTVVPGTMVHGT
jgi:hypothetical protein